jgi:hypothetical protein
MTGYLPNVPGVRIPYHRDGSLVKRVDTTGSGAWTPTSAWTSVTSGEVNEMNDGDGTGIVWFTVGNTTPGNGSMIAIVFPQPITITGHNLMAAIVYAPVAQIFYSTDTIDGTDGTWTPDAANYSTTLTPSEWRNVTNVNIPNVKGIRLCAYSTSGNGHTTTLLDAQIYGQWSPMTLAAWHPTLDQQIDGHELDFGDVMLGSMYTKQFRIKNGRSLVANNVVVSCTSGRAEFISGLTFSLDGTTFTPTVTIPTIAAGGISGTIHVRRTVSAGQTPNIIAMAPIDFVATTWT